MLMGGDGNKKDDGKQDALGPRRSPAARMGSDVCARPSRWAGPDGPGDPGSLRAPAEAVRSGPAPSRRTATSADDARSPALDIPRNAGAAASLCSGVPIASASATGASAETYAMAQTEASLVFAAVVEASAGKGDDHLRAQLDLDAGARRLGGHHG